MDNSLSPPAAVRLTDIIAVTENFWSVDLGLPPSKPIPRIAVLIVGRVFGDNAALV
jgi:hypothetical protein